MSLCGKKHNNMAEQEFIKAGYTVVGTENNENKLLDFLKENYPSVIKDNEIDLNELKAIAGLPIDEKVNGYGLNFIGRNFARAKYAQKTEKELKLNTSLSKDIDKTQNLVLKGDNLDSLKILKNHYSGRIKCIYIDPPYNTANEEFVYPDKFDKEETEVLGLANLSESDFARMDFSFKTKKSHNGWLAFMYPRLLLARDLLSKDGLIFISIDDNEQANLKLLCDDVFGEENNITQLIIQGFANESNEGVLFQNVTEYCLCYAKDKNKTIIKKIDPVSEDLRSLNDAPSGLSTRKKMGYTIYYNPVSKDFIPKIDYDIYGDFSDLEKIYIDDADLIGKGYVPIRPTPRNGVAWRWRWGLETLLERKEEIVVRQNRNGNWVVEFGQTGFNAPRDYQEFGTGTAEVKKLFNGIEVFTKPKSTEFIEFLIQVSTNDNDIILDFFAGSGTTGHSVLQINSEENSNRKFILCQFDEPIDSVKKKEAYDFCITNNLQPVISSITIERLKRSGDKVKEEIEKHNNKTGLFEEAKKQVPDIGFKVFDSVEAPKLQVDEKGQISFTVNESDALSRIYNMIFTVGLDEPTQVPEEVVKDSIYKIGNHYYITNSEKITSDDYSHAIKNGKVFIDGWTASLNGTLQNYKEDVKIVF
jgi:adenine-specific DNA-methyltransferase